MPQRDLLAGGNLALPLVFLQFSLVKSLKIFASCENCPDNHLKAEKIGLEKQFSCYLQFVFSSSISNLVLWIFLLTGIRKDTNMLNGPANLRKFHWRKCDKFYLKDPYFLCRKTLCNRMEICQDWYLSMRRLLNHGSWVFIWYVYFGLAKFLDIEHKHYWTLVALYSVVVLGKIIRYISLSDSLQGILASIIEML